MFKRYSYIVAGSALLALTTSLAATAFTIDEQQKAVLSQLAVARQAKQITAKQAGELDKAMKDFSKLKRRLKEAHSDVLTIEDDAELNKALNEVTQKFEVMTKNIKPRD